MMDISAEEREALEQLVLPDDHGVLDGAVLSGLRERGLAAFSSDGWEATRLGRLAVRQAIDASPSGPMKIKAGAARGVAAPARGDGVQPG